MSLSNSADRKLSMGAASNPERRRPYPIRNVRLPGRVSMEYVEHGRPDGVPVIALHGVTDSWRSFEPVLPHLAGTLRVFALSQRGHGGSEAPATGYALADFADDVVAFLDAQRLERAIIVGHSMGSAVALRLAIEQPRRVAALALLGAFAGFRGNRELEAFWRNDLSQLVDPVGYEFARDFQASTLAQPVPAGFFETVMEECLKCPARVWRGAFAGMFADSFVEQLAAVTAPTLLLWGRHDAFCHREDQQRLLAGITDSRLVEYTDAGHALHWEEPARVAADLNELAGRIQIATSDRPVRWRGEAIPHD
jgi:pimeloyl-ACP methyl ester carboxylesterase